jgi:hypothetical protein
VLLGQSGCDWLKRITFGESMQILYKSSDLTLAWDPPLTDIPNRPTEVETYQIYCREHGTDYWRFLGEVPASPHPKYTLEHGLLGDGLYDFAIRAITQSGQVSPLHSSLDSNADPVSGWYVFWVNTE